MKLTLSDRNYLNFVKFFILSLVALFIFSPGKTKHWPFIYWELYDYLPKMPNRIDIPKTASRIELRVLDTSQNWHSVKVMDLYTIDDDSSSQPGGRNIITQTFFKRPQNWPIYRLYLLKHLEKKLNIKIERIEAYQLTWELNYQKYPPLDINHPTQMTKIDSFKASDYDYANYSVEESDND
jgi:hypothetical protein